MPFLYSISERITHMFKKKQIATLADKLYWYELELIKIRKFWSESTNLRESRGWHETECIYRQRCDELRKELQKLGAIK